MRSATSRASETMFNNTIAPTFPPCVSLTFLLIAGTELTANQCQSVLNLSLCYSSAATPDFEELSEWLEIAPFHRTSHIWDATTTASYLRFLGGEIRARRPVCTQCLSWNVSFQSVVNWTLMSTSCRVGCYLLGAHYPLVGMTPAS